MIGVDIGTRAWPFLPVDNTRNCPLALGIPTHVFAITKRFHSFFLVFLRRDLLLLIRLVGMDTGNGLSSSVILPRFYTMSSGSMGWSESEMPNMSMLSYSAIGFTSSLPTLIFSSCTLRSSKLKGLYGVLAL